MKKPPLSFLALFSLSALTFYAFTQQPESDPADQASPGWENEFASPAESSFFLVLDQDTWEVFDPSNPERGFSSHNTMEARMERYKATLGLEFPDEYQKQFPPTEEEIINAEQARREIEQPRTIEEFLQMPRSPEEQARLEQLLRNNGVDPASMNSDTSD